MKNILSKIGITDSGRYEKGAYIVDFDDFDKYGKYFSLLETADEVEPAEDLSFININESHLVWTIEDGGKEYQITLTANFQDDTNKLVVEEVKE